MLFRSRTALYRLVARHLEPFLARIQTDERHGPLPRFVIKELRAFLDCGLLARGFCRVHCDACGKDDLVAFACKRRGFCPSCGAPMVRAQVGGRTTWWCPVEQPGPLP